jgi:hypothetical protein
MPPTRRRKLLPLWIACLYAGGLLVQGLHVALSADADEHRHSCAGGAAAVSAHCGGSGPCRDPEHHHGPLGHHRHRECPLCQTPALYWHDSQPGQLAPTPGGVRETVARLDAAPVGREVLGAHPIRAPPCSA